MVIINRSKAAVLIAALAAPSAIANANCSLESYPRNSDDIPQVRCLEEICADSSSGGNNGDAHFGINPYFRDASAEADSDSDPNTGFHNIGKPTDNVLYFNPQSKEIDQNAINQIDAGNRNPKVDGEKKEKDPEDSGVDAEDSADGNCIYQTYFSANSLPSLKTDKSDEFNQKVPTFSISLQNEAYVIINQYLNIYGVNKDVQWDLLSANKQSADLFENGGAFRFSGEYKVPKSATMEWGLADGKGNVAILHSVSDISDKLEPFSVVIEVDKNNQEARISTDNGNNFGSYQSISGLAGNYFSIARGTGISDAKFYTLKSFESCKFQN